MATTITYKFISQQRGVLSKMKYKFPIYKLTPISKIKKNDVNFEIFGVLYNTVIQIQPL